MEPVPVRKETPLIGLLLPPYPWTWLTMPFYHGLHLDMLHELSIRYGYHRFFHEVIIPLHRIVARGTSADKEITERLLRIMALLLIRAVL